MDTYPKKKWSEKQMLEEITVQKNKGSGTKMVREKKRRRPHEERLPRQRTRDQSFVS